MDFSGLTRRLNAPCDGASLAVFRVLFGILMVTLAARFFTHDWIAIDYERPRYFFHYWGFAWVRPWPLWGMYLHYGVMALSGVCIAVGFLYRPAILLFFCASTYAHLIDKSNYLNHYYLVSLASGLMVFMPLDRALSLRAWLRPSELCFEARSWMLMLLRFQFALVYFYGGIGKIGSDWLIHGEPLRIWLSANSELPLFGPYFDRPAVPIIMSYCGLFFDLMVVPFLSWRRTRPFAYCAAIFFHVMTSILFKIGMFPWIMLAGATLFFDPSWPRRFIARMSRMTHFAARAVPLAKEASLDRRIAGSALRAPAMLAIALYSLAQLLVPLRSLAYPGNTLWSEEGFRFAWKVMLIEKSGDIEFNVITRDKKRFLVEPNAYFTPFQTRMMSTQPDMILEAAHMVAEDFARRGYPHVEVYVDAQVSFNGRPRASLVDPNVDLAKANDSLVPKPWILPAPSGKPIF